MAPLAAETAVILEAVWHFRRFHSGANRSFIDIRSTATVIKSQRA
jgi:hypothetical protein